MTQSESIDPAALERLREWGGERLLHQMIRLFLENSEERLLQLREADAAGDARGVERAAHSLKSSAGNVGAREVHRVAQELEDAGTAGRLDVARELMPGMEAAHRAATDRLRALLEEEGTT